MAPISDAEVDAATYGDDSSFAEESIVISKQG
jgi:hypothetical protein